MKKCPTCEKTFEDSLRFCQSDGTQLVEVEEVIDPYKTMVARPGEIAAAIPKIDPVPTTPATPSSPEDGEVLQIPEAIDPNKTMVVSEAELRKEMAAVAKSEEVMDIPPAMETPEPPAFIDADLNPVSVPPPPPVLNAIEPLDLSTPELPVGNLTTPPIPSPFSPSQRSSAADVSPMMPQFKEPPPSPETPKDAVPKFEPPLPTSLPSFDEPEPARSPTPSSPFSAGTPGSPFGTASDKPKPQAPSPFEPAADKPPIKQQMTSPERPVQQAPTSNPSKRKENNMTPPGNIAAGQNKTLAIISLVCGILGMTICCGSFIISIVALILGFMARGKANSDPAHYGGAGLALGGMITGAIGLIGSVVVIILYVIWGAAIMSSGHF